MRKSVKSYQILSQSVFVNPYSQAIFGFDMSQEKEIDDISYDVDNRFFRYNV